MLLDIRCIRLDCIVIGDDISRNVLFTHMRIHTANAFHTCATCVGEVVAALG